MMRGAHRLEVGDLVADADRVLVRHGQREGLAERSHGLDEAALAVLEAEHELLAVADELQLLLVAAMQPHVEEPEAVQHVVHDLELLEHDRHGLRLVDHRVTLAAALGVVHQRLLELEGDAQVVDDHAALLVAEDAVHAGDRLHEPVPAHGLVDVHGRAGSGRRSRSATCRAR